METHKYVQIKQHIPKQLSQNRYHREYFKNTWILRSEEDGNTPHTYEVSIMKPTTHWKGKKEGVMEIPWRGTCSKSIVCIHSIITWVIT
jgi:hypothetical protein